MNFKFILLSIVALVHFFNIGLVSAEIKPLMQEFSVAIDKLSPYLVEKNNFIKEENAAFIEKALVDFKNSAAKVKNEHNTETEDMKLRFQQLSEGISEAEATYKAGFRDYSHWVLKSSLNNCFVCHTNKSLNETHYKSNQVLSPIARADFLFLLRNYSDSIPAYETLLRDYPQNKATQEQIDSAQQKLSYYYMKVLKNTEQTLKSIESLLANTKLPQENNKTLIQWKKYLSSQDLMTTKQSIKTRSQLEKFVEDREVIKSQYSFYGGALAKHQTTQSLYELISENPSPKLKPWLLYHLALAEKEDRLSLFDMSTENYLKECMQKHSRSPAAQKCLKLYKEIMHDSFTGSSGTHMPSSINQEIQKYEKLILKK